MSPELKLITLKDPTKTPKLPRQMSTSASMTQIEASFLYSVRLILHFKMLKYLKKTIRHTL